MYVRQSMFDFATTDFMGNPTRLVQQLQFRTRVATDAFSLGMVCYLNFLFSLNIYQINIANQVSITHLCTSISDEETSSQPIPSTQFMGSVVAVISVIIAIVFLAICGYVFINNRFCSGSSFVNKKKLSSQI